MLDRLTFATRVPINTPSSIKGIDPRANTMQYLCVSLRVPAWYTEEQNCVQIAYLSQFSKAFTRKTVGLRLGPVIVDLWTRATLSGPRARASDDEGENVWLLKEQIMTP